ncbi:MAG: 4a-hydroxytetrahydrobiopterin dehydratase [Planctomycetota bacterium]|jgi:4a-hydroxytetrahydrobiopterin dehydratase
MLSEEQLAAALAGLPGWQQGTQNGIGRILKVFDFPDFPAAIRFVNRVVDLAEARNHHPDIRIDYKRVTLELWSHDVGGVTKRDIGLARAIEA